MALLEALFDLVIAILQLVFGVALALFSITVAINILNRATKDINEFEELRKKNLAVGVYIAGILIAVGERGWSGGLWCLEGRRPRRL
jgi:uncharacterized protein YybS (DUF2232 family)